MTKGGRLLHPSGRLFMGAAPALQPAGARTSRWRRAVFQGTSVGELCEREVAAREPEAAGYTSGRCYCDDVASVYRAAIEGKIVH
jgi:hypothetical protein